MVGDLDAMFPRSLERDAVQPAVDLEHRALGPAVDPVGPAGIIRPSQDQHTRPVVFDDRRAAVPAPHAGPHGGRIGQPGRPVLGEEPRLIRSVAARERGVELAPAGRLAPPPRRPRRGERRRVAPRSSAAAGHAAKGPAPITPIERRVGVSPQGPRPRGCRRPGSRCRASRRRPPPPPARGGHVTGLVNDRRPPTVQRRFGVTHAPGVGRRRPRVRGPGRGRRPAPSPDRAPGRRPRPGPRTRGRRHPAPDPVCHAETSLPSAMSASVFRPGSCVAGSRR